MTNINPIITDINSIMTDINSIMTDINSIMTDTTITTDINNIYRYGLTLL